MASTFTDLGIELMFTGENSGTWGDKTNSNLNLIQQALAGYEAVTVNGTGTTTLDIIDATISNGRNAVIKLTGTITGNIVVTIPDTTEKTYIIENGTVGAFTVEFKTASGTGVTFATTDKSTKILFADGTNIVDTGTVSLTGVQTLTNKTLTSPNINEINGTGLILFNDGAYNADATLTDGATITWDVGSSPVAKVTLAGNRTLSSPTNSASGQFISLAVIQDATGSRTLTWNSAYEFTGDVAPTLTTTASKADIFVFKYNGTVWLEVGRNLNLSIT
jgi:hypothetical protein